MLMSPRVAATTSRVNAARRGAAQLAGVLALATLAACATSPDRLPSIDRKFYDNMSSAQQDEFLSLSRRKRQAWLETTDVWAKWKALDAATRERVGNNEVAVGDPEFAAHMAWGLPADARETTAGERKVRFERFILCTSGPKIGQRVRENSACDGSSSETQLAIEQGRVTEIKHLD